MEDLRKISERVIFKRKSKKTATCELCGCEIVKGDLYYNYKLPPQYVKIYRSHKASYKFFSWRKRCLNHYPKSYIEAFLASNNDFNA